MRQKEGSRSFEAKDEKDEKKSLSNYQGVRNASAGSTKSELDDVILETGGVQKVWCC